MATSDIKKGPLYVDSTNSRVGIGTSSPTQATLHVDGGSVPARFESTSASTSYVQFGASGTTNYGQVAMTGNDMTLRTSYTDRMTIDSSGQIIISGNGGNLNNSLDLSYNGVSGQATIQVDSSGGDTYLTFGTSSAGSVSERMRIDSSGRVTMPYQPAFTVKYSSGTFGTDGIMVFGSDPVNIGNHYNTSTGLFTAPVAGTYLFSWQLLSNEAASNYCYSALRINGTNLYYNQEYQTTGVDTGISSNGTVSVSLSANDTVGVWAFGGATAFYGGSSGNYTWFSGVCLG